MRAPLTGCPFLFQPHPNTTMAKLIPIKYVGRKAYAYDCVARSGVTWNGFGDVHEVTDAQAKLLLRHPDEWALVNEKDRKHIDKPESIKVVDEDGDLVVVDPECFKKSPETLNKAELKALAMNKWGREMDLSWSTKRMLDQIEEWDRDLNLITGVK